jgi:hypothetical protein
MHATASAFVAGELLIRITEGAMRLDRFLTVSPMNVDLSSNTYSLRPRQFVALLLLTWLLSSQVPTMAQDSVLVFNEIQYHPANEASQSEWVELRSLQAVDVDIGGWRIEGGIDYTFPNGTVMPGHGYIVIAAMPGQIAGAYGPWSGQLNNGGETVRLVNLNGRVMDELNYDDKGDWPIAPDGSGATLARVSASAAAGAKYWAASPAVGGTPGAANTVPAATTLVFSEISGAADTGFFIELQNMSASALNTSGWTLLTSTGVNVALPAQSISGNSFASFTAASLGFTAADGMKLFLFAPGGAECRDAREVTNRLRGLTSDGRWGHPDSATPGAANVFTVSDAIVINEIFYHGLGSSAEQWIELHNKSGASVDVSGWKFSDGISFDIPAGTPAIAAGGFLVVAWDPAAFTALHPGKTALGPWSGSLSRNGETITLRDANDNVADQVTYADGGRWSSWADGGGSSLELRDPRADNSKGEAWDASDESANSAWTTISGTTYQGSGANPSTDNPTHYNEFVFGLLDAGEFLIDDISVKDVTLGNVELIQNGGFEGDTVGGAAAKWRVIGTHAGTVVNDPTGSGKVLRVNSSGATEHMHNHAETTLKIGGSYYSLVAYDASPHIYNITFRAKWLRGSERLNTRLWHNRLARTTLLNTPTTGGTPGAVNSKCVANIGPTFDALTATPVVPAAGQAATVSIRVADPDGVASAQLFYSVNGGAWQSPAMTTSGGGLFTGTVPAQSAGALVQFYVQATDGVGAVATFPAAGAASRAMIPWADGRAQLTLASGKKPHNFRIVLPTADATELYRPENIMSDAALPCTVILDEATAFYRAGVRLKSSEHGRITSARCGDTLEFPSDDLLFGIHDTISLDHSGSTTSGSVANGQKEILLRRLMNTAGGIVTPEDDLCRVISAVGTMPTSQYFDGSGITGPAILSKTRLDKDFLAAQFGNGGDGSQHKYERIYVLTQTIDPTTRAIITPTFGSSGTILSSIAEAAKVPQSSPSPSGGVTVTSLGTNKENYRWYWPIQNAREADDFTGVMNVTAAIGASNQAQMDQYINVSAWLRACVPPALFGVTDNYLGGGTGNHNTLIYFPPGQKAVLMPWDCDYLTYSSSSTPLTGGGDLAKFLETASGSPTPWARVNRRTFYGHMLDILNRSFNSSYMTTWANHYAQFGINDTDMTSTFLNYLTLRASYATGQVYAQIPQVSFARTSVSPMTVSTSFATITGDGWVNIAEIRLQGSAEPLAVTWTDENSWTLQLPVNVGTNTYTLVAYDSTGAPISPPSTVSVTVTATGSVFPAGPRNLVVSELNYNPPGSGDPTEFLELLNITGATLDLGGCHFDEEDGQGIDYTFPAGMQVVAGGRIVVARNRTAFLAAYPDASAQLAPGQYDPSALDNDGESLVLYAASGLEIFRFSYSDNIASTDGNGRSLVRVLSSTAPNGNSYVWRASTADGGNPGTTDAVSLTGNALADLDGDGLKNLLEYSFGTDDTIVTAPPWNFTKDGLGRWLLTFPRAVNADDSVLTIESVTTLDEVWAPATATLISSITVGNTDVETWQLSPPAGAPTFFARIKATLR